MIKIKYNDSNIFYEVGFSRTENTVTLEGDIPESTSGFTTWRIDGTTQLGNFSDFTTVYRKGEGFVEYSNDGTVYEEPKEPTEEELRKRSLINEKSEIESWLKAHDYIGTKIATGRATIEDYATEITEMTDKAERINQIDAELQRLG